MIEKREDGKVRISAYGFAELVEEMLSVENLSELKKSDVSGEYPERHPWGEFTMTLIPKTPAKKPHHFSKEARAAKKESENAE